jgi:hypothetical protein
VERVMSALPMQNTAPRHSIRGAAHAGSGAAGEAPRSIRQVRSRQSLRAFFGGSLRPRRGPSPLAENRRPSHCIARWTRSEGACATHSSSSIAPTHRFFDDSRRLQAALRTAVRVTPPRRGTAYMLRYRRAAAEGTART